MSEDGLVLSRSEYEHLLEEIHKLQARITELTALRDDLVYHVCPALRAEYDEKIVSLERELMAAQMYLRELQRTIEILQSQMNQQQEPSMEEARAQAKKENKEYEDDLNRKAEEAREFKKKWEESQWAKHDREEREKEQEASGREQERQESDGSGTGGQDRASGESSGDASEDAGKDAGSGGADGHSSDGADGSGKTGETGEPGEAGGSGGRKSKKEETIAQKIKRLYRQIVKRLHPDVHPDPTEHEKDLLNQAMKAFQEGDLGKLERIWDELSGMDAPEDVFDDTQEGREKMRELLDKLKVRLRLLEIEIDHIKTDFPYKLKAFLEDPVAVEEVRRGIMSKLDGVREMNRQLEAFISELKSKLRKGEKL